MSAHDIDAAVSAKEVPAVYCSVGENCLPQGLINRKNLPTCVGPFSWGRLNIDYVKSVVEEDFIDFLNPEYLVRKNRYGKQLAVNVKYRCEPEVFEKSVSDDFEFTHHDVVASVTHMENLRRKVSRFRELISRPPSPIVFLYHHRFREPRVRKLDVVTQRVGEFVQIVRERSGRNDVFALCFTQDLVANSCDRGISVEHSDRCITAVLRTFNVWNGSGDLFWGKPDDDLFDETLGFVAARLSGK